MKKTSDLIWQDKQHQVLFELIDHIKTAEVSDKVFHRLYDYAENHFAVEEEYMKQINYPAMQAHLRAHDRFRDELDDMIKSYRDYDENFRVALADFLTNWLTSHIFGIDKDLEDFILKSQYK